MWRLRDRGIDLVDDSTVGNTWYSLEARKKYIFKYLPEPK